jgi:hypothetical protein
MQNNTIAARIELITMTTPSSSAESQSSRNKFPRRNACTGFMLMKSAVLAANEPPHSLPIPFDNDNYNCITSFTKTTCPTHLIPVSPDDNLNKLYFPLKRSLENLHLESGYDDICNESDPRLADADADAIESDLGGVSLRKPKKCRVSLR